MGSCNLPPSLSAPWSSSGVGHGLCVSLGYLPHFALLSLLQGHLSPAILHGSTSPLLQLFMVGSPSPLCSLLPSLLSANMQTAAPGFCWWGTSCSLIVSSHLHYFSCLCCFHPFWSCSSTAFCFLCSQHWVPALCGPCCSSIGGYWVLSQGAWALSVNRSI